MDDLPLFFIGVLLIIVDVNHAFGLRETIDIFNLLRRDSLSGDLFNVVHHVRRFHLECGLLKNIRGLPGWKFHGELDLFIPPSAKQIQDS